MNQYSFPKVSGGYRWNLLKRCLYEIGLEPTACHDSENTTVLIFSRALTAKEENALEVLMQDNPCMPPKSTTVFKIADIGEFIEAFNQQCGMNLKLFCSENNLELHTDTQLTPEEKSKVVDTYKSLISY
jgi:hypothetical protein